MTFDEWIARELPRATGYEIDLCRTVWIGALASARPEEKAIVAVTLTTHAALDLLAEAFKQNGYPGHAAQLLDRKGFIENKPLVKVIGEENPNMAAIREASSLLAATIAGTNPPGAAWASVRNRMDELTALLSPLDAPFAAREPLE